MSHNIYHMCSRATIPECQPLGDTKVLTRYVTLCLQTASGDITRQGFRVTSGWHSGMSPSKPCDICIISLFCWMCSLNSMFQAIFMIPTKPPPSFRNPDKWSPEFIDFVSKCLVKNPEQRVSAAELMQVRFGLFQVLGVEFCLSVLAYNQWPMSFCTWMYTYLLENMLNVDQGNTVFTHTFICELNFLTFFILAWVYTKCKTTRSIA